MPKKYLHLNSKDRDAIEHWLRHGFSLSAIARKLGVHKSTISRELRRNACELSYEQKSASLQMQQFFMEPEEFKRRLRQIDSVPRFEWNATDAKKTHRTRAHLANQLRRRKSHKTAQWVVQKLHEHWSPEQIAGRSLLEAPEPVSYEYVYRMIYLDRKNGGSLYRLLKRFGKRKQRLGRRLYPSGPIIPNRVSIEKRPSQVAQRARLGDLEGDLIQGYRSSGFILSVIDRKSRFMVLRKLPNKRKKTVRIQLRKALIKTQCARTLTLDNGSEFCDHEKLTQLTGVPVYFTHPYCSTDKGTIENANALVRYFLPKRTCFKSITQADLDRIERLLNTRPRKCLGYLTPEEIHFNKAPDLPHSVALLI